MKNLILIDEYIPLGDTRYVFRILKFIVLIEKHNNNFIITFSHYGIYSLIILSALSK